MKTKLTYQLGMIAALALFASTAQPQQRSEHKKLPNFHQVNNQLYRGAQPKAGDLQELANLGIKTVVNLRGKSEGGLKEEEEAHSKGLRYFSVPFERA
ncbi:MAG: hypothetical protein ABI923_11915 [bacterium]